MGRLSGRVAVIALSLLMMVNISPLAMLPGAGLPGPMSPSPTVDPPVWSDQLDDLSYVFVPDGGLVGVDIVGGEVRLKAGATEGWIASSIITCPPDFRYDLVYLEAAMPGGSYVSISVLNATRESPEVGYANATIPGYVKAKTTDLSVYDVSPFDYPNIRIQVNLHASGSDRPRLLSWSLFYSSLDEWHDDFLGTGKMKDVRKLNITGGQVGLNLTTRSVGGVLGDYDPFPTMLLSRYDAAGCSTYGAFYPNVGRTGYADMASVPCNGTTGFAVDDLDGDGNLDVVVVNNIFGGSINVDSWILWGNGGDTWSTVGAVPLHAKAAWRAATGDLNGDGEVDIVIAGNVSTQEVDSYVFLNQGGGRFNADPDIKLAGEDARGVAIGDLNNDGYDDITFAQLTTSNCFFGGPSGPDATVDLHFPISPDLVWGVVMKDLDGDGYQDLMFGSTVNGKVQIFLGGPDGPDTTADFNIALGTGVALGCAAGDINGDGYMDLVYTKFATEFSVCKGSEAGWTDADVYNVPCGTLTTAVRLVDLDKDGYDEIIIGNTTSMLIFQGGTEWPATPWIAKPTGAWPMDIAIAVPASGGGRGYHGSFTTVGIPLGTGMKWDTSNVEGTFPANTSVKLSVLGVDGKLLPGLRDIMGPDIDLSGVIDDMLIRIRVSIFSEFNWTTPMLDRLTVKWMDRGAWREQFLGTAKVERIISVGVQGGQLARAAGTSGSPQLLFTSLRSDDGYTTGPVMYMDAGGLDFRPSSQLAFDARGTSAVDAADANGDGFLDVAFAVHHTNDATYRCYSQLYMGSAIGFMQGPDHEFQTTGASDVLLSDLNGDGACDAVFAQETPDGSSYIINSTLFWGNGTGWNATPDLQFITNGATGVVAEDLDGDGRLDLAFSCYKDASSTATDSMVFMQGATGFCGTAPSHRLPTKGARAVAAGDVDGDGLTDLAFANSFATGASEIDSYIYWGKAGGGFEATPRGLRTAGAEDVKLADLDGDGDLDVVFANQRNNVPSTPVESYIYLSAGSRTFPASPSARLPTKGAVSVAVADLDGVGRKDVLFACEYDGTHYIEGSVVYLGGPTGWPALPSLTIPTMGATDILVAHLVRPGVGGYMSRTITPEDPPMTGTFHTFRYTASLGAAQSGTLRLIDATSWAVLAETPLHDSTNEWTVADLFWLKEHSSVRVAVAVSGLDRPGAFTLDDLWLNWTKRVMKAPVVKDLGLSSATLLRLRSGTLWVNVMDEYDPARQLAIVIEHRLSGATGAWATTLLSRPTFVDGSWASTVFPRVNAVLGSYDIRVQVTDSDGMSSGDVVFPAALTVANNPPTVPVIRLDPANPVTTSTLQAVVVTPATDMESSSVTYRYRWYRNGEQQVALTTDTVLSPLTTKGENWTIEVRAFDGDGEGPAATLWAVIGNAGPVVKKPLPNPELKEDTTDDKWLNLTGAFEDPDGDHLTWTVSPTPQNITVTIDPATGKVTLAPKAEWCGEESMTFTASDGQLRTSCTILVTVTPVDDIPTFTTVNGQPIASDPIAFTIKQGQLLVIQLGTADVEGNPLFFSANTSAVQVNETTGEVRFQPGGDVIGTLRFAVTMSERDNPALKARLNFAITVENVNDPPGDPRITSPKAGAKYKVDANFSLVGLCTDPDAVFGQVLNFSWRANGTLLGYGTSRTVSFASPGTYNITLTVTDGEFTKTTSIEVVIEAKEIPTPPPPPDNEEVQAVPPYGLIVGAVVAICVVLIVVFMLVSRRRATDLEAKDEAEEKRDDFKRMAAEVKATADQMEHELCEAKRKPKEEWVEDTETEEVAAAPTKPRTEVPVVTGPSKRDKTLSIKPQGTEAATKETQQLFEDMSRAEPAVTTEEQERLSVDNLKRKYQTAIGRLPYGIPSAELKGMDWNELAAALAAGQRRTLADGREVTAIGGRWYYSDPKDTSTFLKEHGARPKAEAKKAAPAAVVAASTAPSLDRVTLLAKLEERFIMGEISEKAYEALRKKYEVEDGKEH